MKALKTLKTLKFAKDALFSLCALVFIVYIIAYPQETAQIVWDGLALCYRVIIPVIFPFLIFARLFTRSVLFRVIGRILNKPAGLLFNLSGEYVNAFVIGAVIGFPAGAKAVSEIYVANPSPQNKNQAERALAFCNNCSISFVVSAAGIAVFGSARIGFILFALQMIAATITGIITRFMFKSHTNNTDTPLNAASVNTNDQTITDIISDAVTAILNICGTVLFFYIMISIVSDISSMLSILSAYGTDILYPIIAGIFEVSSGVYSLTALDLSMHHKLLLSAAILGWSGFSVHFQIMYILKDLKLSLRPYFTGKIIHVIIYTIITMIAIITMVF